MVELHSLRPFSLQLPLQLTKNSTIGAMVNPPPSFEEALAEILFHSWDERERMTSEWYHVVLKRFSSMFPFFCNMIQPITWIRKEKILDPTPSNTYVKSFWTSIFARELWKRGTENQTNPATMNHSSKSSPTLYDLVNQEELRKLMKSNTSRSFGSWGIQGVQFCRALGSCRGEVVIALAFVVALAEAMLTRLFCHLCGDPNF